jgi:hypothetical protein
VQLELVDHIADIIEDLQKTNPALSFSEALQMASEQFSDEEFRMIVKSKTQQLKTKIKKLWWKEFVSYFTIPKILITILLIVVVVWLGQHGKLYKFPQVAYFILTTVTVLSWSFGKAKIIQQNRTDKILNLLMYKVLFNRNLLVGIPLLFYLVLYFGNDVADKPFANILVYKFALYVFPLVLLVCLAWHKTHVEQNIFMRNQYPQAFAS